MLYNLFWILCDRMAVTVDPNMTTFLTITTRWANSTDDKLIFFAWQIDIFCVTNWYFLCDKLIFFFPRKKALTFHVDCLLRRQFAWNHKSYFSGKTKESFHEMAKPIYFLGKRRKKYFRMPSAKKILLSMQRVKHCNIVTNIVTKNFFVLFQMPGGPFGSPMAKKGLEFHGMMSPNFKQFGDLDGVSDCGSIVSSSSHGNKPESKKHPSLPKEVRIIEWGSPVGQVVSVPDFGSRSPKFESHSVWHFIAQSLSLSFFHHLNMTEIQCNVER